MNYNDFYLLYNEQVEFNGFTVYQPKIKDYANIGEDKINEWLLPYMVLPSDLDLLEMEDMREYKQFDLIFAKSENGNNLFKSKSGKGYDELFIESLEFFTRQKCYTVLEYGVILVGEIEESKESLISRNNFNEFCELILKIFQKIKEKYNEKEKEEIKFHTTDGEERSRKSREILLRKQREREGQDYAILIEDIANILCNKYDYSYDEIGNMTIFQAYLKYKTKIADDRYLRDWQVYCQYPSDESYETIKEQWVYKLLMRKIQNSN